MLDETLDETFAKILAKTLAVIFKGSDALDEALA